MMKKIKYLFLVIILATIYSCSDDNEDIVVSKPQITNLSIDGGITEVTVPSTLSFSAVMADKLRPLSTLEVEVLINDVVVYSKSIRTKGNEYAINEESLSVPFVREMDNEEDLVLKFTSINVDGDYVVEQKVLKAKRPQLPVTLYFVISKNDIIELNQSTKNPFIYEAETTSENPFKNTFSGKIGTSKVLDDAEYVWGKGIYDNEADISDYEGENITFNYPGVTISKFIFDAQSFIIDIEGVEFRKIELSPRTDDKDPNMLSAIVSFEKGESFAFKDLDLGSSYNSDFLQYDESKKLFEFLGETGEWEVIYSPKYKAMWVLKMADVAPDTYWIVGHGFSMGTAWHDDFSIGGWDLDDFRRLTYMRQLEPNKYQATIYISNKHEWDSFEFQIFSERTWSATYPTFVDARLTGDKLGFVVGGNPQSITSAAGFQPGYFRIICDMSNGLDKATLDIKRIK